MIIKPVFNSLGVFDSADFGPDVACLGDGQKFIPIYKSYREPEETIIWRSVHF